MKKSYSLRIVKDGSGIALTLFTSASLDVAKRYARKIAETFGTCEFYLHDLSVTGETVPVEEAPCIYHSKIE